MKDGNPLLQRKQLRDKIRACTKCELHKVGNGPIPLSGSTPNNLAIIGEAPGKEEDKQGLPFVGPSGRFLREQLAATGMDPAKFTYINTVSCWPKGTPNSRQRLACHDNLTDQLNLTQPLFCLVLGSVALSAWWQEPLKEMRGLWWRPMEEPIGGPWMMATWHPSAVLRTGGIRATKGCEFAADLTTFYEIAVLDGKQESLLGGEGT